jgi:hypothetical protein
VIIWAAAVRGEVAVAVGAVAVIETIAVALGATGAISVALGATAVYRAGSFRSCCPAAPQRQHTHACANETFKTVFILATAAFVVSARTNKRHHHRHGREKGLHRCGSCDFGAGARIRQAREAHIQ